MEEVFTRFGVCNDVADNIAYQVHNSHLMSIHKELLDELVWWRWVQRHCGLDYVYWLYWYPDEAGPSPSNYNPMPYKHYNHRM